MIFVADEGVENYIVERLRSDGHRVLYVAEQQSGISDDEILALAQRERAVLITADKDFGELVFRLRRASHGVMLLRLAGISKEAKCNAVSDSTRRPEDELKTSFTVVTPRPYGFEEYLSDYTYALHLCMGTKQFSDEIPMLNRVVGGTGSC
ncbi:MAG: DUF5615 family PIN-like protein [Ignavibacteriae bacterium]|nr:DUF5615 family PIN-like protein [Ignavibacteriota bacterium]